MSEKLYKIIEITDLKDMLNKTKDIYSNDIAYKIRVGEKQYKEISHKKVREMIDSLGTALINMGLKKIVWLNILDKLFLSISLLSYKSFNILAFVGVAENTETKKTNNPYGLVLKIREYIL